MCCTYVHETLEIGPKWLDSGRELDAIEKTPSHAGSAEVTNRVPRFSAKTGKRSQGFSASRRRPLLSHEHQNLPTLIQKILVFRRARMEAGRARRGAPTTVS
jgi:hypothetical protein